MPSIFNCNYLLVDLRSLWDLSSWQKECISSECSFRMIFISVESLMFSVLRRSISDSNWIVRSLFSSSCLFVSKSFCFKKLKSSETCSKILDRVSCYQTSANRLALVDFKLLLLFSELCIRLLTGVFLTEYPLFLFLDLPLTVESCNNILALFWASISIAD